MACSDQISTQDLENAKTDAVTLGEVATSRAGAESEGAPITQSTNRFGETTDTVQGRLNKLGVLYDDPIKDWSASLLVSDLRAHRYPATTGDVYIPVKPLPFTTGGAFNTDDWVLNTGYNPGEVDQQLINDLSQSYDFDTHALMVASLIVFPIGKILHTKGYHDKGDTGRAKYIVTTGLSPNNAKSPDLDAGNYAALVTSGFYTGQQIGTVNDTVTEILSDDDITVFNISDGTFSGQSHRVYLPWDVRRDSHSFLMSPETIGGQCDTLWRRSGENPDDFGNRFSFDFSEAADGNSSDTLSFTYATSDSGAPSFDVYMAIKNGTDPSVKFPALAPLYEAGFSTKKRTTGVLELQYLPQINEIEIKDKTSGNEIATVDKSGYRLGGIKHTNLTDLPERTDCNNFGIVFKDGDVTLPSTTVIYSMTTGTFQSVLIEMMASFTSSGAAGTVRKTTWHYDGTTLTPIDVINTLPVQVTADIVINGTELELQADYTGGLGGGYEMSVMLSYCTSGR